MTPKQQRSNFTQETADEICARLSLGESLRSVCRSDGTPPESTVRRWSLDETQSSAEFVAQYARAREVGMEALGDELLEIADDGSNDWMERHNADSPGWQANGEALQRSKLRVDTRKWLMSKIAPKKYGDRVAHVGPDNGPVEMKDVTPRDKMRALAAGLRRELEDTKVAITDES